jgi:hypothetical protein
MRRGSTAREGMGEDMDAEPLITFFHELPGEIDWAMGPLTSEQLRQRPAADEWSAIEVACHLRDALEIEGMRIRAILAEPGVTLPAFDGHAYLAHRLYRYEEADRVIAGIQRNADDLANLLANLTDSDWKKGGVHEEAGPVTVASRAQGAREHGEDHLQQIKTLLRQMKL